MSQAVPEFGVWNDPDAEKFGFTNTFDVVRKVRRDRSSMDHISVQQTIDANPHLRKGPATNYVINEKMRNERPPVRYDNNEIWETQSAKSTENSVPTARQSRRPPAPNERRRHDLTPPVRYDNDEIWETQSATENSVSAGPQSRRPTAPNERRRHDLTAAEYQKVLISQDDPRLRHERPRTAPSPGTTRNALMNSSLETQHRRKPTSSSDDSSRDLVSSREEELKAKATYQKPKGPTALTFGKWNVDPNCTQEYTREFAIVRHKKENSVMGPANNNPAPQSYYMENPQPKRKKGTKMGCLDCLFPRVKTYERWT